ncbi:DUF1294 domain-containing protein [Streptococcus thoraltensis]|uniref:DUF1294 domain-containing protein n=1 Tax=Streptococcus thoraltensis TaxID=55085 RepID=UPI000382D5FF|nr:DUF1294 domain-containing protein [Streptococcus thoraltensis]MDY4761134.1 DUF1294 domain-containing protein [Streptococcus thoraltensis]
MLIIIMVILLIWNFFVFLAYGYDKRQAIKGNWRVTERFLLTVTLLFGGLGALLGAKVFHHKTQKWYFIWTWWLGILLTLSLFCLYFYTTSL